MGKKQKGFSKETLSTIAKNFALLVDHAKDNEGLPAAKVYDQIYGDEYCSNKEDKISKMKHGKTITPHDVMKIQAWKNLSLDWLVLGKGDPPPELQEKGKNNSDEKVPSDTVCGFLISLMYLSLSRYVRDFRIKMTQRRDPDEWECCYHDVEISFSLIPFRGEGHYYDYDDDSHYYSSDYYECDTALYLDHGLRRLSSSKYKLLELPNDDPTMFDAKIKKYAEILDRIPPNQLLSDYTCTQKKLPF